MTADVGCPSPRDQGDTGLRQVDSIVYEWLRELRYGSSSCAVHEGLITPLGSCAPLGNRLSLAGLDAWAAAAKALAGSGETTPEFARDLLDALHHAAVRLAAKADHPDLFQLCREVWTIGPAPGFAPADPIVEFLQAGAVGTGLLARLRERLREDINSPLNSRAAAADARPLTTRDLWPGHAEALLWDSWAYQVVARVWPGEFMAMISELPPVFAHAAVGMACKTLQSGEAAALLRSAPPSFDANGVPTRNVGVFALVQSVGDRIVRPSSSQPGTSAILNVPEVLDAVLVRPDGQWLARAWLQRLIWESHARKIGQGEAGQSAALDAFRELLWELGHRIQPLATDPYTWIEAEEDLWRAERVLVEGWVRLLRSDVEAAGEVLAQAVLRGFVTATGRPEGMHTASAEALIAGSIIAGQPNPAKWFNDLWAGSYDRRERLQHYRHQSLDNPAYPALTWGLSGLNHLVRTQGQVELWDRLRDALIETRLTNPHADLRNGALGAATRVAAQIGGFLITRGVIKPRDFSPLLEHMAAPVEEFAIFMTRVLASGISTPLIQAGREVGRELVLEALAGALDAARPRPPIAIWDVPENPLSDEATSA